MADLTISRTIKSGTTPFDADSPPVLRDPTAAFGLRRDDTLEIIVAAGVALTRMSTGVYQMPVTGLVAGQAYTYYIETTINGATSRVEKHYTAPLVSALPSYLTVDAADAIAGALFGLAAWAAASAGDKLKALTSATARVDAAYRWQGRQYCSPQALEFPRYDNGARIDADPSSSTAAIVPAGILRATLLEADSILAGIRDAQIAQQHDGLLEEEIGTAKKQYAPATTAGGLPLLCHQADAAVQIYRLRSGRLL